MLGQKGVVMKLGDILTFRSDLYFEGAVQADWFYRKDKAAKVAENFVFHGKKYFGIEDSASKKRIDTISLVEELSNKLNDEDTNPLTLAIADYGTGKSHLAVTLGQLFSGQDYMPETYEKILSNIANIDIDAASRIRKNLEGRNLVLVINGMRDFNLHSEILKAVKKSFELYGIDDGGLKNLNRAFEIAESFFERNCTAFLSSFESEAKKIGWFEKGNDLLNRLRKDLMVDEAAFEIVNSVYKEINGQNIQWDEGLSAGTILDKLVSDYCGMNGQFDHIILLFDEFGRYLEYASSVSSGKSGDSALQQIFEASQNAHGTLQVINFIQSDIKTYLQRVDQTKNISRYIGRYDASDKYYISSNLETVFANLIQRKNQSEFNQIVVDWQKRHETEWDSLYDKIKMWLQMKGIWNDKTLFRKVIVEGIYPMHPLSTFMLTQLSDYLQNRSSLTLVSHYINEKSEYDMTNTPVMILPEELMRGDLYTEMLASEQEGKQPSQHCIRFDNIVRKFGDKLPEEALQVLRSNLILRILRFKTKTYDEAKDALKLCCNLTKSQIDDQLTLLEDEYAILSFDERAGCFDFMEESNGAHDFKILKKRLISQSTITKEIITSLKIQRYADVLEPQTTNFANKYRISTNEWLFKQELMPIENFNSSLVEQYLNEWNNAYLATEPKGRLIWLYANKYTDGKYIVQAGKLVSKFKDTPILVMLLNDADNKLMNSLIEFDVLDKLDEANRQKFKRHFDDEFSQAELNLRSDFQSLKKERNLICSDGSVKHLTDRLPIYLTTVFERIYPDCVPFFFDQFITKNNNFGGKGSTYYCTIIKMLLSGKISSDILHNYPIDIRNRVEALLLEKSNTSWKCITNDYKLIPPQEKRSGKVYDMIKKELDARGTFSFASLFEKLHKPPFGMCDEVILLMISVFCANLNYFLRIKIGGEVFNINAWKENLVLKDKKINWKVVKEATVLKINVDASTQLFVNLFDRIKGNRNINKVQELSDELDKTLQENELPETLNDNYMFVRSLLQNGFNAKKSLDEALDHIETLLSESKDDRDFYLTLKAKEELYSIRLDNILNNNNFDLDDETKKVILEKDSKVNAFINGQFPDYVSNLYCQNAMDFKTFKNHNYKVKDMLNRYNFPKYASQVQACIDREERNVLEMQARNDLRNDLNAFLEKSKITPYFTYVVSCGCLKEAESLDVRLKKYMDTLGVDKQIIAKRFYDRVAELRKFKFSISNEMESIYDDYYQLSSIENLKALISRIDKVVQLGLSETDSMDYKDIKEQLNNILNDLQRIDVNGESRKNLITESNRIKNKYLDEELEFDLESLIDNEVNDIMVQLNAKEKAWKVKYLNKGLQTRADLLSWLEETSSLPDYLSDSTIAEYNKDKEAVDARIKEGKIEDVLFYFNKLKDDEKKECIEVLKKQLSD